MLFHLFTLLLLVSFASVPAFAQGRHVDVSGLQVSMLGDVDLDCHQLSREAGAMHDLIGTTQVSRDDTKLTSTGISAAGALGSLILGGATGGLGLAAAGYMAHEANDDEAREVEGIQDIAEQRRSFMIGIYNAKGCNGPIEHALQDKSPADPLEAVIDLAPAAGPESVPRGYNN